MVDVAEDDSNIIGQRLKYEMKKRGISSAELSKRADVKTSFIYDIISGKSTNPSTVKLARVADALGISLEYLVDSGNNSSPKNIGDYVSLPRLSVEFVSGKANVVAMAGDNESVIFKTTWVTQQLRLNPTNLRLLAVRGDSMEPSFHHNDTVLIDTAQTVPSSPGFFVIFDGFGLAVKRIELVSHSTNPRVRILSDNPQYTDYERSLADANIVGRIVWFCRDM